MRDCLNHLTAISCQHRNRLTNGSLYLTHFHFFTIEFSILKRCVRSFTCSQFHVPEVSTIDSIYRVCLFLICFDRGSWFSELMNYCVTMATSSAAYSLALQHSSTTSFIILSFRSGNVFHRLCLGSSLRGRLLPRKILSLIPSFSSFFDTPLSCNTLIGVGEKLDDCLTSSLPGTKGPSFVNPFLPTEFENSLNLCLTSGTA